MKIYQKLMKKNIRGGGVKFLSKITKIDIYESISKI